ncbi:hypothetical protein BFL34_02850 [Clavibacter michiganensis]|uniref:Lipoprotein n=1 Tax=Clavibacter michiganensis TaxID=28447 RepID=A0A251Y1B8_9MICO|nr:hypothetical protein [Clavibacter michiganensis]OUE18097.1 hypothetical protein BFL34_02850 [Clavibacter michiganensis]
MRSRSAALALALPALLLAGCSSAALTAATMPPADELTATATVLQRTADDGAMLCAGGVADSLPPLCGGPVIAGWDWDAVDDEETVSGVTWGDYDVVGTWDGTTFTLTRPPAAPTRPGVADGYTPWPDPADQSTVTRALADYHAEGMSVTGIFELGDGNGRAMVSVFHDDGSMQAEADARYGEDVVVIESALRPVGAPRD